MDHRIIAALGVLIVLGLAVFACLFLSVGDESGIVPPKEGVAAGDGSKSDDADGNLTPGIGIIDIEVPPGDPSNSDGEDAVREAVDPTGLFLSGRVVDDKTEEPVKPFHLTVIKGARKVGQIAAVSARDRIINEAVNDDEGRFTVRLEEPGLFDLLITSPRHKNGGLSGVSVLRDSVPVDLEVRLDPGLSVSGMVVDDVTGEGVTRALIGTTGSRRTDLALAGTGTSARQLHAWTDVEGHFVLGGLDDERQKIVAVHDDYAEGWAEVLPAEAGPVEIRLRTGPCVFGRALDDAGKPCPGVTITLLGDELPLSRSVLTGAGGKYRTFPVNPGMIDLRAVQKGLAEPHRTFSTEWKYTEVKDQDVEVDFGPSQVYVTWHGTLFGVENEPLPGANISLYRTLSQRVDHRIAGMQGRTDEQGRFRFPKLYCGSYDVSIFLPDKTWMQNELTVHLDTPGEVQRDINLAPRDIAACGTVRGVLVDGATGRPIKREEDKFGYVILSTWSPAYKAYTAYIDENGVFELAAVPAGTYDVSARATDYPPKTVQRFKVKAGDVIDDLRIAMPVGGELRVRLEGFLPTDPRTFTVDFDGEKGEGYTIGQQSLADDGTWEYTSVKGEGTWTVTVIVKDMGLARRECRIMPGRTAGALFRRDDFQCDDESITVACRLTRPDGTPAPDVTISFYGTNVPGLESGKEILHADTDEDGAFDLDGFRPGKWSVTALLGDGVNPNFTDMVIPSDCDNPHPLHLVMPNGTVSGTLVNGLTGKELDADSPLWWVFVTDIDDNRTVSEIQDGHRGAKFELPGVPACRFVVTVSVREFFEYKTAAFAHSGAGKVDVGKIPLQPSGVLDLLVSDRDGNKMEFVQLFIEGKELPYWRRWEGPEGSLRYDRINPGTAAVAVGAAGFRTYETELNFEAGVPERLDIVLEKR